MKSILRIFAALFFLELFYAGEIIEKKVANRFSAETLFGSLDNDKSGDLSNEELKIFIDSTKDSLLDENSEVGRSTIAALASLTNANSRIEMTDLKQHWHSIASNLDVEEVRNWALYAQQLPPYVVDRLYEKGVTGYDFSSLVADAENGGHLLESEMGIKMGSMRRRILRGMKIKLLGVGRAPPTPKKEGISVTPISCSATQVVWETLSEVKESLQPYEFPVHMYVLQRLRESWETIYAGSETSAIVFLPLDEIAHVSGGRAYRISSWNLLGRSEWFYFEVDRTTVAEQTFFQCGRFTGKEIPLDTSSDPLETDTTSLENLRNFSRFEEEDPTPLKPLLKDPRYHSVEILSSAKVVPVIGSGRNGSWSWDDLQQVVWMMVQFVVVAHSVIAWSSTWSVVLDFFSRCKRGTTPDEGRATSPCSDGLSTSMISTISGLSTGRTPVSPLQKRRLFSPNEDDNPRLVGNGMVQDEHTHCCSDGEFDPSAQSADQEKCYICTKRFKPRRFLRPRVRHMCSDCGAAFCSECGDVSKCDRAFFSPSRSRQRDGDSLCKSRCFVCSALPKPSSAGA